jgi:hypothetical protein
MKLGSKLTNTETQAPDNIVISGGTINYHNMRSFDYYADGMHYRVFQSSSDGGMFVVNVTKDSLEISRNNLN